MFSKNIHTNDYYIKYICQYINSVQSTLDIIKTPYIFVGDVHSSILQLFLPLKQAQILKSINFNYSTKLFEYELDLDNLDIKPSVVYVGDIVGRSSHSFAISLYFAFMNIIINVNQAILNIPITSIKELNKLDYEKIFSLKNSNIIWVFGNHDVDFINKFLHVKINNIPTIMAVSQSRRYTSIEFRNDELYLLKNNKYFNKFIFLLLQFALYNPYPYIFTVDYNSKKKKFNYDRIRRLTTDSRNIIKQTEKLILSNYTPGIKIEQVEKIYSKTSEDLTPSPVLREPKRRSTITKIETHKTPEILKILNKHIDEKEINDAKINKVEAQHIQASHTIVNKYKIKIEDKIKMEDKSENENEKEYTIFDNLLFFKCINDNEFEVIKNRCIEFYNNFSNIDKFDYKKYKKQKIDYYDERYKSLREIDLDSDIWFNDNIIFNEKTIDKFKKLKERKIYCNNIDFIFESFLKFNNKSTKLSKLIDELELFEEKLGLKLDIDKMNDYIRYLCIFNPFPFGRLIESEIYTERFKKTSTPLIYKSNMTLDITKAKPVPIKRAIYTDEYKQINMYDFDVDCSNDNINNFDKLYNKKYNIHNLSMLSITHNCYKNPKLMKTIQFYGHDGNHNGYLMNSLDEIEMIPKLISRMNKDDVINRIYTNDLIIGYQINNIVRNYLCKLIKKYYDKYDLIVDDIADAIKIEAISKIGKEYLLNYYPIHMSRLMYIDKNTLMHFIDFNACTGIINLLNDRLARYSIIGHNLCMFAYVELQNDNIVVKYSDLYSV